MSLGLSVDTLIALHDSGASTVTLTFTDTLENIAGASFDQFDNQGGNTYLLQKLKPGVSYRLTFNIMTETFPGSGNYVPSAQNITASDVHSSSSLGEVPIDNNYFFYNDGGVRYVAFKTALDDQVSVVATGMTRYDTAVELYRPHASAAYTDFIGFPSYYDLSQQGQPTLGFQVDPTKHSYDGYLFLFYHENASENAGDHVQNTNASLTNGLRNRKFIGATAVDPLKGFKRIVDIHSNRVTGAAVSVNFTKIDFEAGGVFGEGLRKNGKYIIGLVLHDKNSNYIPYEYDSGTGNKLIKWYSFVLNEAGNWQIFLRNFVPVSGRNLHPSTAGAIEIDSISTVGSFSSTDNIRIVMTATPFTPP
jgi:hypothetical protein